MSKAQSSSEPGLSMAECPSPDIFTDGENSNNTINLISSEEAGPSETQPTVEVPEWKGISMDEIHKGLGAYGCQQHPPVSPSARHTVLISLSNINHGPPKPYPSQQRDKWSAGYVRMPHSPHSLYPNNNENGSNRFRHRWEVIQEALLQSFVSSQQLETAILSYNQKYAPRWDFSALHHFFSMVVDEDDAAHFFEGLLPQIVQLALQLPTLVTGAIPLLKRHTNMSISLSQLQVGALLANAFLCTFPRRNSTNPQSEYAMYPEINFNRLFSAYKEERYNRSESVMEKLKCIFNYFRRITTKAPEGIVTIERRHIAKEDCPTWNKQNQRLPPLHITSCGTIETEGAGLLQVDFANKFVGGGVLGWGCVQEEIRFMICPELMVTMLVTEALDDTEALVVTGVERYSNYEGYADSFKWKGNFEDETPRDNSGRRMTSVVAIDALLFRQPQAQFNTGNIIRELNKAYVGFSASDMRRQNLSAVATGNWGCGAFQGNPQLKVLLQLMAAAVAGRPMVYFTFGDTELRDKVASMYWHLVQQNIDVAQLFLLITQYQGSTANNHSDFYHSLYKRCKMKPLTSYFCKLNKSAPSPTWSSDKKDTEASATPTTDPGKGFETLTSFSSKAKQKEDIELQTIENWLDEAFAEDYESPLRKSEKLESAIDGKKSLIICSDNTIQTAVKKRKYLTDLDDEESSPNKTSQSTTGNNFMNEKKSQNIKKKACLWDSRPKDSDKPRLSGLDLMGTLRNSSVDNDKEADKPQSVKKKTCLWDSEPEETKDSDKPRLSGLDLMGTLRNSSVDNDKEADKPQSVKKKTCLWDSEPEETKDSDKPRLSDLDLLDTSLNSGTDEMAATVKKPPISPKVKTNSGAQGKSCPNLKKFPQRKISDFFAWTR